MSEYEVYRSKYKVTEWRDDSVYVIELVGTGWYDMAEVDHPNTVETNILYGAPEVVITTEELRGIRRKH